MRTSELNAWWAVVSAVANAAMSNGLPGPGRRTRERPSKGPAIIAFNHVSVLDGPAVGIVVARKSGEVPLPRGSRGVRQAPADGSSGIRPDPDPTRSGRRQRAGRGDPHVKAGAIAALAPEGRVNEDGARMLRFLAAWLGWRWRPEPRWCPWGSGEHKRVAAKRAPVREAVASTARVRVRRGRGPSRGSGRRRRPGELHTARPEAIEVQVRGPRDRGGRMSRSICRALCAGPRSGRTSTATNGRPKGRPSIVSSVGVSPAPPR